MTVIALLPWLACVLGAILYFAATRAELKEAGRLAYACGLLVGLLVTARAVVLHLP